MGNNTLHSEREPTASNTNVSGFMPTSTTVSGAADNVKLEVGVEYGSIYLNYNTGFELNSESPHGMKVKGMTSICNAREVLSHIYYNPLSMNGGKMNYSHEVQKIAITRNSSLPFGSYRINYKLEWLGGVGLGAETLSFTLELQCEAFIPYLDGFTVESAIYEMNGTISEKAIEDAMYALFKSCEIALEDEWPHIQGSNTATEYVPPLPVDITGNLSSILVIANNVTQNIDKQTWEIVAIYSPEISPATNALSAFTNDTTLNENAEGGWVITEVPPALNSFETFRLSGRNGVTLPIPINIEASELEDLITTVVGTGVRVTVGDIGPAGAPSWLVSYTSPGDFPPLLPDVSWVSVTEIINGYTPNDKLSVKVTDAMGLSDTASIYIGVELINMPPVINFITEEKEGERVLSSSGDQVLHVTNALSNADGAYPIPNVAVTTISRQEQSILFVTVLASGDNPQLNIEGLSPQDSSHVELEMHSGYLSIKGFPQYVNSALKKLHWYPPRMFSGLGVALDSVGATELRITAEISSDVGTHSRMLTVYADIEILNTALIKTPLESISITSDCVCTALEGISFEGEEWELIVAGEDDALLSGPFLVSAQADRGFMCQSYLVLDVFEEVMQALQQSLQYTPPPHYIGEDQLHITVVHPRSGIHIKGSANINVETDSIKMVTMKPELGGNLLPELHGDPLQPMEDSELRFGPSGIIIQPISEEGPLFQNVLLTITLGAYNGNVTLSASPTHTWIDHNVSVSVIGGGRILQLEGNFLEKLNYCLERVVYQPPQNYAGWDELVINVTETAAGIPLGTMSTTVIPLTILPVNDAPTLSALNSNISVAVQGELIDVPVVLSDVDAADSMGDGLVTVSVEAQMNGDRVVIGGGEMLIVPPYLFEMTIEGEPSEKQSVITFTASLESAKHALSHLMLYTTYAGNHAITVTVNDTGNYGSGGAMVTSLDLDVNVTESKTHNIPTLVTPLGVLVVNQGSELLVSGIRIDIPWSSSMWIEEEGDSIMRLLAMSVKIKSSTSGSILKTMLSHSNAVALGLISISDTNSTTSSGNEVELVGTLFGICHAMEMPFIYAPPPGFTGIDTLVLEAEAVDNMHSLLYNAAGSVHGTWNWTSTAHMNILVTNADHTSQLSPAKIIGGEAISAQYDKIIPVTAFSLVPIYDNHTAITLSVKCSAGTLDLGPAQAGLWVHSQSSSDLVSVSGLPKNINSLLSAGKLLYNIPLDKTSDDTVERTVDLCAWIVGYAGDEASHMCTSIVIQPMEHCASLSPTELLNGLKSDGLLHMKEGESIRLSSIFSVSAGGNEAGELFEMNVSAVTGTREGRIWFSNVSSIAQASPVAVSGSGTALLSLVASPEDMSFLVEHILFHPPYLFNGVSWLKISIVFFAGHLSSILSSKTVPIVFEAVNNPPQIQVLPGSDVFYGIQDQIIEIGSRGLYVTDPDAQENGFSASLNVTVSVIEGRGTLELPHNSPEIAGTKLSVKYGSGSISLTGPIEALNVALASLIFIPDSKWGGLARIRLKADDLGNTGFGGPQQAIPVELVVHIDAIVAPPRIIAPQYYSGFQGRAIELLNVTIMDESTAPGTEIQLHVSSTKGERQITSLRPLLSIHPSSHDLTTTTHVMVVCFRPCIPVHTPLSPQIATLNAGRLPLTEPTP